ncbi:MAG TPA: phosphotransferase family protein [Burkholderiales bacterium]|nr:phosphotransferase family protein [Burkholderiales bacterium]
MNLADAATRRALETFITQAAAATSASITAHRRLSGGAIQENHALDVVLTGGPLAGPRRWVMRCDAPSAVAVSLTRAQEFAVLKAAHAAGVKVPAPLWCSRLGGDEFFIMEYVDGVAAGHRLARDERLVSDRRRLAEQLGENLARIHAMGAPVAGLDFLELPSHSPAEEFVAVFRAHLDALTDPHPALEWGLRWCELNRPQQETVTFVHHDHRTGNYIVRNGELAAVLDWEFAGYGDPLQDIGWFFARCWRFGRPENVAGGIGAADDFLRGYERASGKAVDRAAIRYWEVAAHIRWAVIALQQAQRHFSGEEPSLELALTRYVVPELEYEIVEQISDGASPNPPQPPFFKGGSEQELGAGEECKEHPARCAAEPADSGATQESAHFPPFAKGGRGGDLRLQNSRGSPLTSLLAIARKTFRESLLPVLPETQRYDGLMVARAIDVVARKLARGDADERRELARLSALFGADRESADRLDRYNRRLADAIRAGGFDEVGDRRNRIVEHLKLTVRDRLAISNPRYLEQDRK